MIVKLKNFKHHRSIKFTFDQEVFLKLSGNTGSGKSSLIQGIIYAIYGKAPNTVDIVSYGEPGLTTSITLRTTRRDASETHSKKIEYTIVRKNKPRSVELREVDGGDPLEDLAAEEAIIELMGLTYGQFTWGYYGSPASGMSLLGLTPSARYEGLCEIIGSSKEEQDRQFKLISAKKKECQTKIDKLQNKYDIGKARIKELKESYSGVREEVAGIDAKIFDGELDDAHRKLEKIELRIRELEEAAPVEDPIDEEKLHALSIRKSSLESQVKNRKSITSKSETYSGKKLLKEKDRITDALEILSVYEELEEAKKEHSRAAQDKLRTIEKFLDKHPAPLDIRTKLDRLRVKQRRYQNTMDEIEAARTKKTRARKACAEIFRDIKSSLKVPETIKSPKKMIDFLTDLERKSLKVMGCPGCGARLILPENGGLEKAPKTSSKSKAPKGLRDYIAKLKSLDDMGYNIEVPEEPEPPTDPSKLEKILTRVELAMAEKRSLITGVDQYVSKLESKFAKLGGEAALPAESSAELQKAKTKVKKKLAKIEAADKAREELTRLEARLEDVVEQLFELLIGGETEASGDRGEILERELKKFSKRNQREQARKDELIQLQTKHKHLAASIQATLKTAQGADIKRKIENLKSKNSEYHQEISSEQSLVGGLEEVRILLKEALLRSFERALENINLGVEEYLGKLFDKPISIKLELAEDASGRVLSKCTYLGTDVKFASLSAGEQQRASFAFFLAFADYLDSIRPRGPSIMILDEVLNDVETNMHLRVLELIRDRPGLKIVVAHKAVSGFFDDEYLLGEAE